MNSLRILVDIGHPAHVHYFRNAIAILKARGHKVLATARRKPIIQQLLDAYEIDYIDRGSGKNSLIGKLLYMVRADIQIFRIAKKFKPDIFLSFTTPYPAHVSFVMRKPHIAMNDTEHVDSVNKLLTHPFCDVIFTPESYLNSLGSKQVRFKNLVEGLYLNEKYFKPNRDNLKSLNLKADEKFVILRFVSWNAHHDVGQTGLDNETKRKLIDLLEIKYRVFITSEDELPQEFRPYEIRIDAEKMHDVLAFAELFVGESSTMATECALLGTYAVYINSLPLMCNIKLGEEAGVVRHFRNSNGVLEFVKNLIDDPKLKEMSIRRSNEMQKEFEDFTLGLVEYIENGSNNYA
jgi:predicted glycosyltransferase